MFVPDVLGTDQKGREVLRWIPGEPARTETGALRLEVQTDAVLEEMAELLRRIHDATTTFPAADKEWNPLLRDPSRSTEVVCHNDVSFHNTVFQEDSPVALIDWELAAPGSRLWDVAYAAWWLVPLHRPEAAEAMGWLFPDQPRRLRLFVDAYGVGEERKQLVDAIYRRQAACRQQLRKWVAERIIPAFDENDPAIECGRTDYIETQRFRLDRALLS